MVPFGKEIDMFEQVRCLDNMEWPKDAVVGFVAGVM
jgi:hypothetical protein